MDKKIKDYRAIKQARSGYRVPDAIVEDLKDVDLEVDTDVEEAGVSFNNGKLTFGIPKPADGKDGKDGKDGQDGASAVFDPNTGNILATLENTTGMSDSNAMTQKAVTEAIDDVKVTERVINLNDVYSLGFYYYNSKWYSSNTITGKHICTRPGQRYRITSSTRLARIWMMETYSTPVNNGSASATKLDIPANTTQVITIPNGIYHLYIQNNSNVVENSEAFPSEVIEYVSESIVDRAGWVGDISSKSALVGIHLLAKYDYTDLTIGKTLLINGSLANAGSSHFAVSDYIPIPSGATILRYENVNANYNDINTGICLCDSSYHVLWYDNTLESETIKSLSGTLSLSDYPSAAYVRFMPAVRNLSGNIRFYKYTNNDYASLSSALIGKDEIKAYGCMREGDSSSYASSVQYATSQTPCDKDGTLELIYGKFTAGTCTIYIGHIDQNGYIVIRDAFAVTTVSGFNKIDISLNNIQIYQGEYLLTGKSGAVPYFKTGTGDPAAFYINQSGHAENFGSNTYLTFAWSVKSHVPSVDDIRGMIDDVKTATSINTSNIEALKNNKNHYVVDEVTGDNYKIVVRNGVISLQRIQFSKALVLGNSIAIHEITDFWWGEWGMAATKPEYDFVHILHQGLQAKDNNASIDVVQMRPWEQDFSTSLSTLIGNKLDSDTDLVVIRVGGNVPATNLSNFQSALENLVDYIHSVSSDAYILITGNFGVDAARETPIINAARAKGIGYIKIDQFGIAAYKEEMGHYVYGDDDEIHEIDNSGVAWHPSNKGMLAIANAILNAIGYDSVNQTYSLQQVTVGSNTGTMYVKDEQ